uniref:Transthyretin-like family-containing protein n=1 Tax=Strongyloides venezuelensis TaxID=75913 RepID=A0A0K0FMN5_STRVS
MIFLFKTFICIILVSFSSPLVRKQQYVRVVGKLICNDKPIVNEKVKLWNNNKLRRDDKLAEVRTNSSGYYEIQGSLGSIFTLDVRLKFYTNCGYEKNFCLRKIVLTVPDTHVSRCKRNITTFDGGIINLAFKFPGERRDCIN